MKTKAFVTFIFCCSFAFASNILPITVTDEPSLLAYLNATTYLDFSNLQDTNFQTYLPVYGSISDSNLSIGFFESGYPLDSAKITTPTWGVWPNSQRKSGAMPTIDPLWYQMTLQLSRPAWIFGIELMPEFSDPAQICATFHGLTGESLAICRDNMFWNGGSAIFAASGGPITQVDLRINDEYGTFSSFMFAAPRYSFEGPVPEPATGLLIGAGLIVAGLITKRRRA